jgi:CheY-like chemotaxis protein
MRLRICRQPTGTIDGISLQRFRPGLEYEVGTHIANVLLAEGWAEPVPESFGMTATKSAQEIAARLLVVDDDADLRQFTAAVLVSNGYDVVQAQHGREALVRLTEDNPDLVVLDLNMPVMDGWQFCAEQERLADGRLAATPVLLLTGAERALEHQAATKAVALVQKPFEPEVLLVAIKAALHAATGH